MKKVLVYALAFVFVAGIAATSVVAQEKKEEVKKEAKAEKKEAKKDAKAEKKEAKADAKAEKKEEKK